MNFRDRVLLHTPPALQSLVTTAGSHLRFGRRFGSTFRAAISELEANERLPRKSLLERQTDLARHILGEAREHVPYYRGRDLSVDRTSTWPILDKETIRSNPDDFLSDRYSRRSLLRAETSGTSGSPLSVFSTPEAYQWEMAFRWRHRGWAGIPFGAKGAYLSGHLVVPQSRSEPPFWVYDGAERRLIFSSYHMSDRNLPAYISALVNHDPDFIHGYPSSLFLVARALRGAPHRPRPRAVFAASETLLAHQRAAIEDAFGCKVYVWYGQTEQTLNIVECERGSLHLREDYGVMESLGDGTTLGTGLRNPAMPMIRYRTGDVIVPREGECECGRPFSLIHSIEGRVEDYIVTPGGARVGRLDHLFKGAAGVVEAQVIQDSPDSIRLRIVRGGGYCEETERTIQREALARLGPEVAVHFEFVSSIPRAAGGKFRFVVSNIPGRFPRITPEAGEPPEAGNISADSELTGADTQCDRSR